MDKTGISRMDKTKKNKEPIMKGAIAIFAKTIGLSPVKTRLAKDLGKEFAEEFYRLSLNATKEIIDNIIQNNGTITPYWALAEEEAYNNEYWNDYDILWTGEGDLGNRLNSIYSTLLKKYDYVIMIGTDSPQLEPKVILNAIERINADKNSCIIGPCNDGGFYLFLSAKPISEGIWTNVTYSKDDTLSNLAKQLENNGLNINYLPHYGDVDIINDLEPLMNDFYENKNLLPNQQILYSWLISNKEKFIE